MTPDAPEAVGSSPADEVAAAAALLRDGRYCPHCRAELRAGSCHRCGIRLDGLDGRELWTLSQQAAGVLDRRRVVLDRLRAAVPPSFVPSAEAVSLIPTPEPTAPAPTAPAPTAPAGPPAWAGPPPWAGPPVAPPPAGVGVQTVLLSLGALLIAVFVLFFMAVAWAVLPLAGRALAIVALTAVAIGVAWALRSRLRATAEAVASIAVVLLLADAWAVHRLGFLGADAIDGPAYTAGATAVVAVVLAGWARLSRLRAPSVVAAVLGPAAAVITGLAVFAVTDRARDVALGFLGAALVSVVRRGVPERLGTERLLLSLAGIAGIGSAAVATAQEAGDERLLTTALLLALCALVTAAQGWADGPLIWSPVAGAFAASAVVPAALWLVRAVELDDRLTAWPLVLVPLAVAVVLPVAALVGRRAVGDGVRGPIARPLSGAVAVWVLVLLPAAGVALVHLAQAAGAGVPAWQMSVGASVGRAGRVGTAGTFSADESLGTWPPALLAALLVCGTGLLCLRSPRITRRARGVAEAMTVGGLGVAAVLAVLAPRLPLGPAVLGLITVAACATVGATVLREHTWRAGAVAALVVAALAGTLAVLLSWATEPLSVPITVLGVAALLLARAALPPGPVQPGPVGAGPDVAVSPATASEPARAVLAGAAGAAGLVALGAAFRWAGAATEYAATAAGVAGALLAAAVLSTVVDTAPRLPGRLGRPWAAADRWILALAGAVAVLVAFAVQNVPGTDRPARQVLLGGLLLGIVLIAARPHAVLPRPGPPVAGQAAALVTAFFAGSLCVSRAATVAVFALGLVLALAGVAAVVRDRAVPGALALRLRVRGSFAALAFRCGTGAAVAGALTGLAGRIDAPAKVWTAPVAVVLLVAGMVRLTRDPGLRSWRPLAPGLVLLLLPSLWLSLIGAGTGRPVVVLVLGGAVVAAGALRRLQAPLVLGSAALVLQVLVLVGPYVARAAVVVPFWITGGLVGLTLLTLGAMYEFWLTTARTLTRRVGALR